MIFMVSVMELLGKVWGGLKWLFRKSVRLIKILAIKAWTFTKGATRWAGKALAYPSWRQWLLISLTIVGACLYLTPLGAWMARALSNIKWEFPNLTPDNRGKILVMSATLILLGLLATILAIFKKGWRGGGIVGIITFTLIGMGMYLAYGTIPKVRIPFGLDPKMVAGAIALLIIIATVLYLFNKNKLTAARSTAFWAVLVVLAVYAGAVALFALHFPEVWHWYMKEGKWSFILLIVAIPLAVILLYRGRSAAAPLLGLALVTVAILSLLSELGFIRLLPDPLDLDRAYAARERAKTGGPSVAIAPQGPEATANYRLKWVKPSGVHGARTDLRQAEFMAAIKDYTPDRFVFESYYTSKNGKGETVTYVWDRTKPCGTWRDPGPGWFGEWFLEPAPSGFTGWIKLSNGEVLPTTLTKQ